MRGKRLYTVTASRVHFVENPPKKQPLVCCTVHGHFSHSHTLETNWPTKWEPFITIKRTPMSHYHPKCVCNVLLINFHIYSWLVCSPSLHLCECVWVCDSFNPKFNIFDSATNRVCLLFTAEILHPVNLSIRWVVFSFADDFLPDDKNQSLNRIERDSACTLIRSVLSNSFFLSIFFLCLKVWVLFVFKPWHSLLLLGRAWQSKNQKFISISRHCTLHRLTGWLEHVCTCNIQYDWRTRSAMGRQIERAWSEMCILMCMDFRWKFQYRTLPVCVHSAQVNENI